MRQATCEKCRRLRWVNIVRGDNTIVGEFCADCYDWRPLRPTTSISSGPNHNDPGWDNVIRAYEEDR